MSQLQIDWTDVLHRRENNAFSEAILKANHFHLVGQCAEVFSRLMRGERLSSLDAIRLGITRLASRIHDLRRANLPIEDDLFVVDGKKTRFVVYFISETNRQKLLGNDSGTARHAE